MTKSLAESMKIMGSIIIVTVMLIDHFIFSVSDGFILVCAIISAILLSVSIVWLKIDEVRSESLR